MRFRHIIWDFDGTLFDSYPALATAFQLALEERGISVPIGEILPLMKISMTHARGYYKERYGLDDAFFARYEELRTGAEERDTRPFDGAVELCRAVCAQGGANYLFTHRGDSTGYFMEKFGLTELFSELVTSRQGFSRKPSPEAILYLMEKYGFRPEEAVMLGDREIDMRAAKNAGISACFFAEPGGEPTPWDCRVSGIPDLYEALGLDAREQGRR